MEFVDRILKCFDCGEDFVFTAGEQLFFFDRQFKNDPKRCKLCKAKRAGLGRVAAPGAEAAVATLPLSRTETRTECSACGIETTVPFKPTQGRPVFCRSCFQLKRVPAAAVAKGAGLTEPGMMVTTVDGLASAATMDAIAQSPAMLLEGAEPPTNIPAELLAEAASA
jgi:CxxC-x17-CxxC domain-containing protein